MLPSLGILLRGPLTDEQRTHITQTLEVLAASVQFSPHPLDILGDKWLVSGFRGRVRGPKKRHWQGKHPAYEDRLIGLVPAELDDLDGGGGVVYVTLHQGALEDIEYFQYQEELGYLPEYDLSCHVVGKKTIHHRILGTVAVALAEALDTYIALEGDYLGVSDDGGRLERILQAIAEGVNVCERATSLPIPPVPKNAGYDGPGHYFKVYLDPSKPFGYSVLNATALRHFMQAPFVYFGD